MKKFDSEGSHLFTVGWCWVLNPDQWEVWWQKQGIKSASCTLSFTVLVTGEKGKGQWPLKIRKRSLQAWSGWQPIGSRRVGEGIKSQGRQQFDSNMNQALHWSLISDVIWFSYFWKKLSGFRALYLYMYIYIKIGKPLWGRNTSITKRQGAAAGEEIQLPPKQWGYVALWWINPPPLSDVFWEIWKSFVCRPVRKKQARTQPAP